MKAFIENLKNAVFPRFCVACKAEGALLCASCEQSWILQNSFIQSDSGAVASFSYADPIARDLIKAWKYHFDESAWHILQKKLIPNLSWLEHYIEVHRVSALIPIPLHFARKAERGFDQAQELASFLSEHTKIPVRHALSRKRSTQRQTEQTEKGRVEAMRSSPFKYIKELAEESGILLIDDVFTTGATTRAAMQTLATNGQENIKIYTLAQGKD